MWQTVSSYADLLSSYADSLKRKLSNYYKSVKAWFKYSESLFIARITAFLGLVTAALGSMDWSGISGVVSSTGFTAKQIISVGIFALVQGIVLEWARRRNDPSFQKTEKDLDA